MRDSREVWMLGCWFRPGDHGTLGCSATALRNRHTSYCVSGDDVESFHAE